MRNALLLENLPLAIGIAIGAYAWYRRGFRTPRALRITPHRTRRMVVSFGWTLIAAIFIKSIGGLFGDQRVAIANSGPMYAYRRREPLLFWGEIAGEMVLVGVVGVLLVIPGRRTARVV